MADPDGLSSAAVATDLRTLGLESGDEVVVHGSLSSLGWVDGGADVVVDALRQVVGESGTVVVPTFTPSVVREEPFDRDDTRSRTGAITEALRTRSDAVRSDHPTHSVSARGPAATTLTEAHDLDSSLGRDSPLHCLADRGGRIFLLGVGHERNSTVHVAEALADLPYKTGTNRVLVRGADGEVRPVESSRVGCGKGFPSLEPVADNASVLTRSCVGAADAQLMDSEAILSVASDILADAPGFLLCSDPKCWWCPDARRTLESGRD